MRKVGASHTQTAAGSLKVKVENGGWCSGEVRRCDCDEAIVTHETASEPARSADDVIVPLTPLFASWAQIFVLPVPASADRAEITQPRYCTFSTATGSY